MLLIAGLLLWPFGAPRAQDARAAGNLLAPTPPMGWNSWDSYGLRINEQQFRDNVAALAAKLKPSGYTYAVIDKGRYMANPEDRPKPETLKYDWMRADGSFRSPRGFLPRFRRAKIPASNRSQAGCIPRDSSSGFT